MHDCTIARCAIIRFQLVGQLTRCVLNSAHSSLSRGNNCIVVTTRNDLAAFLRRYRAVMRIFPEKTVRRITSDRRLLIAEPRRWSAADVAAWVQWARRQLQLPSVPLESFNVDGATLASLSEEEFCQRAPQVSANALSFALL